VKTTGSINRPVEIFSALLFAIALGAIQILIGGTRLLFSLPAYGLLGVVGLLGVFSLRSAKVIPSQVCLASAAAFFGYVLLRALLSPAEYLARSDIYSVLGGLLVYCFVAFICTSPTRRMIVLLFLFVLALVHVFIGAMQFRDGNNFMPIWFLQRYDYGTRASGFYVCPNDLAGLLEVLGVFGLSITCWSRWPAWGKLLTVYITGMCYVGLVLTGSRGGYVSTTVSLLVFGVLSLIMLRHAGARTFWRIGGLGLVAAAVIGISAVFFINKSDFLMNRAQNIFDTTNMRIDMWKAGLQQWKLQPVFGTGSGTYLYYGRLFRTEQMQKDPIYVHNDYLQLLAEYGLVGGGLFVLFLATHVLNGWKNFRRLGPKRVAVARSLLSNSMALNVAAIAAVSAYTVHSFVDFNLHIPANVLLLAFVFGILANAGTQREDKVLAPNVSTLAWRLALPILGLIVAVQCVRLLPGEYFAERARTAQRENHSESAIQFAVRGLATEKKNPNLYHYLGSAEANLCDSIADLHARMGCYEKAIAAFEKARALAPQDRTFLLPLAYTYDTMGRFAEAEWMWEEALRLDPKSISLNEAYQGHLGRWQSTGTSDRQQTNGSSAEK